jgi:hypothetical protein
MRRRFSSRRAGTRIFADVGIPTNFGSKSTHSLKLTSQYSKLVSLRSRSWREASAQSSPAVEASMASSLCRPSVSSSTNKRTNWPVISATPKSKCSTAVFSKSENDILDRDRLKSRKLESDWNFEPGVQIYGPECTFFVGGGERYRRTPPPPASTPCPPRGVLPTGTRVFETSDRTLSEEARRYG